MIKVTMMVCAMHFPIQTGMQLNIIISTSMLKESPIPF